MLIVVAIYYMVSAYYRWPADLTGMYYFVKQHSEKYPPGTLREVIVHQLTTRTTCIFCGIRYTASTDSSVFNAASLRGM